MKIFIKSIILLILVACLSNAETKYSDLIKPKPALAPLEVLLIQLNSLKNNNEPYKDAGIEQTWEFAHPNNKIMTGPLDDFKLMLHSENYKILIGHEKHDIEILRETNNVFMFKVSILSKSKKKYYYIWQVEKVFLENNLKNCWMTTVVSSPVYIGDVI